MSSPPPTAVVGGPGPAEQVAAGLRKLQAAVTELAPGSCETLAEQMRAAGALKLVVWVPAPGRAGVATPLLDHDEAAWDAQAAQPLRDAVACFQAAQEVLSEGGAVVAVLPTLAMVGSAGFTAWSTAAEGLRTLVKVSARDFGKHRITVNAVAVPAATLAASPRSLDRPGLPPAALAVPSDLSDDVTALIAALAAPPWTSVSGATIALDGGVWVPA